MTPSQLEETKVEDLDVSKLSDEELADVAKNDTRSTAQEKAKAEISRRESAAEDTEAGSDGEFETTEPISRLPLDPEERAEALGLNTDGMNFDPDFGQIELQDYADAVEESGVEPPTGGPPDTSHTIEEVVKREAEEKEARREEMEAQAAGK